MHIVHRVASTVALAGAALGFAGCSDSTITTPRDLRAPTDAPARVVTVTQDLNSGSSTQLCGFSATTGTTFPAGPCSAAFDLNATLAGTYNPGWFVPAGTAHWVGPQADAPQYTTPPGTYLFQTTFNIPAGATSPSLSLGTLADNAVAIYLNGHSVGQQTAADCGGAPCNWDLAGEFNVTDANPAHFVTGTNTVSFYLSDTRIGEGQIGVAPDFNCAEGPQGSSPLPNKLAKDGGTWVVATCFNPGGLWYSGTASYTPFVPPPAIPLFVIGDLQDHKIGDNVYFWGAQWWKNNPVSGIFDNGWESFKGFADVVNGSCGSTWESLPGNSSKPPKSIGSDIAIIVTSTVTKNGNNEGGNIVQILIVHTDPGYAGNPGHTGTGTVTSVVCSNII